MGLELWIPCQLLLLHLIGLPLQLHLQNVDCDLGCAMFGKVLANKTNLRKHMEKVHGQTTSSDGVGSCESKDSSLIILFISQQDLVNLKLHFLSQRTFLKMKSGPRWTKSPLLLLPSLLSKFLQILIAVQSVGKRFQEEVTWLTM